MVLRALINTLVIVCVSGAPLCWQYLPIGSNLITRTPPDEGSRAWGYYKDEIDKTGWSTLHIYSNKTLSASVQMEAAGYFEGVLTATRIGQMFNNTYYTMFPAKPPRPAVDYPENLGKFMETNQQWISTMIQKNPTDKYWMHVNLIMTQMKAMQQGYTSTNPVTPLSTTDFWFMNSWGDIDDVMRSLQKEEDRFDFFTASHKATFQDYVERSRCTSIIKLVPDFSDIWITHTTWSDFTKMVRIFKKYDLPLEGGVNQGVLFSGYPGLIASLDDYYQTSNGMVVTETTNDICNKTLFSFIKPHSIPYWIRAVLANRVAQDGPQWVKLFIPYNSGTYNNQWIILDFNKIKRNSTGKLTFSDNALTIMEIIPGTSNYWLSADKTDDVESSHHWFSYNRPYYPSFFETMGYLNLSQRFGDKYDNIFSYGLNPRALILKRDVPTAISENDLRRIAQYNDWQNDPIESGYAGNAIAARFDLKAGPLGTPYNDWFYLGLHGGIDSKLTSFTKWENKGTAEYGSISAISGPTHDQQPVFCWKNWGNSPHYGHPACFDFSWESFDGVDHCL